MSITIDLVWWLPGVIGLAIGVCVGFLAPKQYSEFMGWPSRDYSAFGALGLLLAVLSALYLGFGWIARSLP